MTELTDSDVCDPTCPSVVHEHFNPMTGAFVATGPLEDVEEVVLDYRKI